MRIVIFAILAAVVAVLVTAAPAFAWGPSAHLYVGREILSNLELLPIGISSILSRYPLDFLYGSVFADMHLGKKFLHFSKLVHNWRVGFELKDSATTDANLACSYGYLAHLAADVVSHNEFIPKKLVEHYLMMGRGHIFFEGRFDALLPDHNIHSASKKVVDEGSVNNDGFLERSLNRTLFSFNTNKKLYRGLLSLNRHNGLLIYRKYRVHKKRRISEEEMAFYLKETVETVVEFFEHGRQADCYSMDPHGLVAIKNATRLRNRLRLGAGVDFKTAMEKVAIGPHRK